MITAIDRCTGISLIKEASLAGARRQKSCEILGLTLRTLERWEKEQGQQDKRKLSHPKPANKLTEEERKMILATANSAPYQELPLTFRT